MPEMRLKNGDDHAYPKLEAILDQMRRLADGQERKWNCTLTKTGARTSFALDIEHTPAEAAKLAEGGAAE